MLAVQAYLDWAVRVFTWASKRAPQEPRLGVTWWVQALGKLIGVFVQPALEQGSGEWGSALTLQVHLLGPVKGPTVVSPQAAVMVGLSLGHQTSCPSGPTGGKGEPNWDPYSLLPAPLTHSTPSPQR